jgi:hypothetical protein
MFASQLRILRCVLTLYLKVTGLLLVLVAALFALAPDKSARLLIVQALTVDTSCRYYGI